MIVATGCSTGFGLSLAELLARRGGRVYASMREPEGRNSGPVEELERMARDGSLDLQVIEMDVTSTDSILAAVTKVVGEEGRIDVLINNAGQLFWGITEAFTADQFRAQLEVNLIGPFQVMREVVPIMRCRRSGLIVQISSISGRVARPLSALYNASKFGLEGLSESLRYELSPDGIDVVVVEPGPFATSIGTRIVGPEDQARVGSCPRQWSIHGAIQDRYAEIFNDPDAPTDPRLVAEAVAGLIDTDPGERPFRTVVGLDLDTVREVNEATEPLRLKGLDDFGLSYLADVATAAGGDSSRGRGADLFSREADLPRERPREVGRDRVIYPVSGGTRRT